MQSVATDSAVPDVAHPHFHAYCQCHAYPEAKSGSLLCCGQLVLRERLLSHFPSPSQSLGWYPPTWAVQGRLREEPA